MELMIYLVILLGCLIAAASKECPPLWLRYENECYRLVRSVAVDSVGFPTVYHARQTCLQYGGDLAYLRDGFHENVAFGLIRDIPQDTKPRKIYIGLTDLRTPGHFEWMNQQPMGYQNWAPGEPNNGRGGAPEACVVVRSASLSWQTNNNDTEWHDYPCCKQFHIRYALCSRGLYDTHANTTFLVQPENDFLRSACNTKDECEDEPCQNGAICHDEVLSYTCECSYGYKGEHCETKITCPMANLREATVGTIFEGESPNMTNEHPIDYSLTVSCAKGFSFDEPGNPVMKLYNCTEDGWQLIEKNEIQCDRIATWSGIVINTNSSGRHVGSYTNYSCEKDYVFKTDKDKNGEDRQLYKLSTCNESGLWEPPMDECVEAKSLKDQMKELQPEEAPGAEVLGTFGLIFLIAELSTFVLLDVNVLVQQIILGFKNIKHGIQRHRKPKQNDFQLVPATAI